MNFDIEIPMLWKSLWLPSLAATYEGAIQYKEARIRTIAVSEPI
jgi:hypothetical protein